MRREGLYASIISKWRSRDSEKRILKKAERGRPAQAEVDRENAKLREEIQRLHQRATKAESLVQTLGKVSALLQHAVSESISEHQSSGKPLGMTAVHIGMRAACTLLGVSTLDDLASRSHKKPSLRKRRVFLHVR